QTCSSGHCSVAPSGKRSSTALLTVGPTGILPVDAARHRMSISILWRRRELRPPMNSYSCSKCRGYEYGYDHAPKHLEGPAPASPRLRPVLAGGGTGLLAVGSFRGGQGGCLAASAGRPRGPGGRPHAP